MSEIHAAIAALHLRFFDGDVDVGKPIHEMSDPYDHFCTASINDAGVGRMEGVTFKITHKHVKRLKTIFRNAGAKCVQWRHEGKDFEVKL